MNIFPNGARVCFIGDSLVAANQILPRVIDFYNKSFPECNVRFFNCGTSGGTYKTAIDFFDDDVLPHAPTHAVVAFGVNDSERWLLSSPRSNDRLVKLKRAFENYKKCVATYCDMLISHNIEVTICTPAAYDEYTETEVASLKGGYALVLGYADFIRSFAKERGISLCDYHDYMSRMIETATEEVYSPDHVHPVSHGYYLMAKCFLEYQGLDIGKEEPIPDYFNAWAATVEKLRVVFGGEQMGVRNYFMPLEEKMEMMEDRVRREDWEQPAFKRFILGFVAEKRNQEKLYKEIDELYERDIFRHYSKSPRF